MRLSARMGAYIAESFSVTAQKVRKNTESRVFLVKNNKDGYFIKVAVLIGALEGTRTPTPLDTRT